MDRTDNSTLIAFEGIDGAGKTTQVGLLAEFFKSASVPVVTSKEPTDGKWGRKIRESAKSGRHSPAEELRILTEDRKEHLNTLIRPALTRGDTVILDRYFYSTIAYQGTQSGQSLSSITQQMFDIALKPDAVIILDVPAEIGMYRIQDGRGETPNAFETVEHLRIVRDAFREIAGQYDNVIFVNGTQDVEGVRREIVQKLIDGVLKKRYCAKAYGCDSPEYCSFRATGSCAWAKICSHARLM